MFERGVLVLNLRVGKIKHIIMKVTNKMQIYRLIYYS